MSSDPSRNRRLAERMLAGPDPLSLDAAAHPPRSVAGYDVLRVLGRGGAGVVLEARRPGVEERVAIKWLTGAASASPAQRRRLWREADALREIRHPHVARVRELGQHEGAPYVVLDLYPGGSLRARLDRDGPLSPQEVVRLGLEVASGLAAAHAAGVLHRDVKPENVLLDAHDHAVLCDFGLAKALDPELESLELTHSHAVLGTLGYMAPEQALAAEVSPRTDVYGLGALLYSLLAGRPPCGGEVAAAVVFATVQQPPVPLRSLRADVPRALEAVILRCLEKDPQHRYPGPVEVLHALRACSRAAPERAGIAPAALAIPAAVALILAGALLLPGERAPTLPSPTPAPPDATPRAGSAPRDQAAYARAVELLAAPGRARDAEAHASLREAAAAGHVRAMHTLGELYRDGRGTSPDPTAARTWLARAAEAGDRDAMVDLADVLDGEDPSAAARWYRRAAELGDPEAMFKLGSLLSRGHGALRDDLAAADWFRRAAEGGVVLAMRNLGVMACAGQGMPRDLEVAETWFLRAAERGDAESMNNLGALYTLGEGVPQDDAEARRWYRRAAEAGSVLGMNNLGRMLAAGRGGPRDDEGATRWLRRAAEGGYAPAMRALAERLDQGLGVQEPDPNGAARWRARADAGEGASR